MVLCCVFDHLERLLGGSKPAKSKVDAGKVPVRMRTREVKVVRVYLLLARFRELEGALVVRGDCERVRQAVGERRPGSRVPDPWQGVEILVDVERLAESFAEPSPREVSGAESN